MTPEQRAHLEALHRSHWRDHPGLLIPFREWVRQKLPTSRQGFVLCGDDGLAKRWTDSDPLGGVAPIEVKVFKRKGIDYATHKTFESLLHGRILEPMVINLVGGNTPGPLRDWPPPCDRCGLPQPAIVAEHIYLNDRPVTEAKLIEAFLAIGPPAVTRRRAAAFDRPTGQRDPRRAGPGRDRSR